MEEGANLDRMAIDTSEPIVTTQPKLKLNDELKELEQLFCENLDKVFNDSRRMSFFVGLVKTLPSQFYKIARELNFDISGPNSIDSFLSNYKTDEEKRRVLCSLISQVISWLLLNKGNPDASRLLAFGIIFDALAASKNVERRDLITLYFKMKKEDLLDFPSNSQFMRRLESIRIDFLSHFFYWLLYSQYFNFSMRGGVYFRSTDEPRNDSTRLSQRTPTLFDDFRCTPAASSVKSWWKSESRDVQEAEEELDHFLPFPLIIQIAHERRQGDQRLDLVDQKIPIYQQCKLVHTEMKRVVSEFLTGSRGIRAVIGGNSTSQTHVACLKLFTFDSWLHAVPEVPLDLRYFIKEGYYTEAELGSYQWDLDKTNAWLPSPSAWLDINNHTDVEDSVIYFLEKVVRTPRFWDYFIANVLLLFDLRFALEAIGYVADPGNANNKRIVVENLNLSKVLQLCFYKSARSNVTFPKIRRFLADRNLALRKFLLDNPEFFADVDELKLFWAGMP